MKINQLFTIITLILLSSCNPKNTTVNEQYIEDLQKKEFERFDDLYKNAGDLIAEIEFNVKATTDEQKADWEDGVIPWISIENPNPEINQLINADEIIVPQKNINIIIDYPLNNPANLDLSSNNGFSRKDLILAISKKYNEIYAEEEKTAKTKTIPMDKRTGLINRNETDGKYGIWGHDLSDLDLSGIEVHQTKDGKINIILSIES